MDQAEMLAIYTQPWVEIILLINVRIMRQDVALPRWFASAWDAYAACKDFAGVKGRLVADSGESPDRS